MIITSLTKVITQLPGDRRPQHIHVRLKTLLQFISLLHTLRTDDLQRNCYAMHILNLVAPFASFHNIAEANTVPSPRKESCIALSLGAVLDVAIDTLHAEATIVSGGKGPNQLRAGHALGNPVTLVGLVPSDDTSIVFRQLLSIDGSLPANCHLVEYPGQMRVGIHINNRIYPIPGHPVSHDLIVPVLQEFRQQASKCGWIILAGTFYPGIDKSVFFDLAREYSGSKKVVIDSKVFYENPDFSFGAPFLLKPNLAEFIEMAHLLYPAEAQQFSANMQADAPAIVALAKKMVAEKGIKLLVISNSEAPFIVVSNNQVLKVTPPVIKMKSDRGSGDALTAGILDVLSRQEINPDGSNLSLDLLTEAVSWGSAFAAACAEEPGSSYTSDLVKVRFLQSQVRVEILER